MSHEYDEMVGMQVISTEYEEFIYQLYQYCIKESQRLGYMVLDRCPYTTFYQWVKTVSTGPPKYV